MLWSKRKWQENRSQDSSTNIKTQVNHTTKPKTKGGILVYMFYDIYFIHPKNSHMSHAVSSTKIWHALHPKFSPISLHASPGSLSSGRPFVITITSIWDDGNGSTEKTKFSCFKRKYINMIQIIKNTIWKQKLVVSDRKYFKCWIKHTCARTYIPIRGTHKYKYNTHYLLWFSHAVLYWHWTPNPPPWADHTEQLYNSQDYHPRHISRAKFRFLHTKQVWTPPCYLRMTSHLQSR